MDKCIMVVIIKDSPYTVEELKGELSLFLSNSGIEISKIIFEEIK